MGLPLACFLFSQYVSAVQPTVFVQGIQQSCVQVTKDHRGKQLGINSLGVSESALSGGAIHWSSNGIVVDASTTWDSEIGSGELQIIGKVVSGPAPVPPYTPNIPGLNFRFWYYPQGGYRAWVKIDQSTVSDRDRGQTFLATSVSNRTSGGWVSTNDGWQYSLSVESQVTQNRVSELDLETIRDLSNATSNPDPREVSLVANYQYRILSPDFCNGFDPELLRVLREKSSYEIMRTSVCIKLIPTEANNSQIGWSQRYETILPIRKQLTDLIVQDSSPLDRFDSTPFRELVQSLWRRKVNQFNSWANHNFSGELTRQAGSLKDLARTLDSPANPTSTLRMLESMKQYQLDQVARIAALQELKEVHQERREIAVDKKYPALLDQIELFAQTADVDFELINQCIESTRQLAREYREQANQLILERDSYAVQF
ncbi:MAG: hypothetical protein ACO3A2_11165 [Bdellovibrionia bacterium]